MEAIKTTYEQFLGQFSKWPASTRVAVVGGTLLIAGALGYLVFFGKGTGYVPASLGKSFNEEEMQNAQTVLRERGLTDFKQTGTQLLVPRSQVDEYNAALLAGGGLPTDWASEMEKQFDKEGWFPSDRQSQLRREIALGKALRRIIRAIPEIEDARVIWARSEPRRFSGRTAKVTATVNVKPRGELSPRLIQSLRQAVANMISGLNPDDVTIFDLKTGESFVKSKDSPFDGELIDWIKQHTRRYKQKLEEQLSFIPDVLVTVDVQVENLESHVEQIKKFDPKASATISERNKSTTKEQNDTRGSTQVGEQPNVPRSLGSARPAGKTSKSSETDKSSTTVPGFTTTLKKYIAAMPKAVKVSVGVPEEYFEKVSQRQSGAGASGQTPTRQQLIEDIKTMVAHAVGADPNGDAVEVRPYVRVDREIPEIETPFTETAMTLLSRWGGPIGLGLFAILALWMVKRNMPKIPEAEPDPLAGLAAISTPDEPEQDVQPPKEQVKTPRDLLQESVRDNPEMAAAVIGEWMKAAG